MTKNTNPSQTFEKLTDTTYVSADWRYAIEFDSGEWIVKEQGNVKKFFTSLDEAIAWTTAWDKGEATR